MYFGLPSSCSLESCYAREIHSNHVYHVFIRCSSRVTINICIQGTTCCYSNSKIIEALLDFHLHTTKPGVFRHVCSKNQGSKNEDLNLISFYILHGQLHFLIFSINSLNLVFFQILHKQHIKRESFRVVGY